MALDLGDGAGHSITFGSTVSGLLLGCRSNRRNAPMLPSQIARCIICTLTEKSEDVRFSVISSIKLRGEVSIKHLTALSSASSLASQLAASRYLSEKITARMDIPFHLQFSPRKPIQLDV